MKNRMYEAGYIMIDGNWTLLSDLICELDSSQPDNQEDKEEQTD